MEYPKGTGKKTPSITTSRFYGLNNNDVCQDGYFADCRNVVSEYPAIHSKNGYKEVEGGLAKVTAMIKGTDVEGFCGVANGTVYWDGAARVVSADSEYTPQVDSEKFAYMFNGYMYIWERRESGKVVTYRYDVMDRRIYGPSGVARQVGIVNPKINTYDDYGRPQYVTPEAMTLHNPVSSAFDNTLIFNPGSSSGDSNVILSGGEGKEQIYLTIKEKDYQINDVEPVKAEWEDASQGLLYYKVKDKHNTRRKVKRSLSAGEKAYIYEYGRYPMQLTRPTIWRNRVWQGKLSGEAIVATAFDSGEDFWTFDNTASDSVEISVNSNGGFKGVFAYGEALLAFKKNSITVIYGDTADDFAIGKTIEGAGTCDIRSVVSIGGRLYFCDGEQFYMYSGGYPKAISQNLKFKFTDCIAYGFEGRYIAEGTTESGSKVIYTYDTEKGIWLSETAIGLREVITYEDEVFLLTDGGILKPKSQKEWETTEESWFIESTDLYEGIFEKKGISEIFIRTKIGNGNTISVYTIGDDGEKRLAKTVYGTGKIKTYRIPITYSEKEVYRYRIEGDGPTIIYDIERNVSIGGRNISVYDN